jgi:hypothetical protein
MINPSDQVDNRLIIPPLELIRINRTVRIHDQIESHEIEAQDPHLQRLMMAGKDGVRQIIKAFVTVVTLIALPSRFGVIKATLDSTGNFIY